MKIDRQHAHAILQQCDIDPAADFHALPSRQVEELAGWANLTGYRKPASANGSTARYFHAKLIRALSKS